MSYLHRLTVFTVVVRKTASSMHLALTFQRPYQHANQNRKNQKVVHLFMNFHLLLLTFTYMYLGRCLKSYHFIIVLNFHVLYIEICSILLSMHISNLCFNILHMRMQMSFYFHYICSLLLNAFFLAIFRKFSIMELYLKIMFSSYIHIFAQLLKISYLILSIRI